LGKLRPTGYLDTGADEALRRQSSMKWRRPRATKNMATAEMAQSKTKATTPLDLAVTDQRKALIAIA
jgi:hypothetical protein